MALQTPDGVLHPADLDEYGQYQPIHELIRMTSCDADLLEEITEDTRNILRQAFLGENPLLSYPLVGMQRKNDLFRIMKVMKPQSKEDFTRTLCLIRSEGLFCYDVTSYPFVCREELRDYLCQYINGEQVFELSEAVRKGLFSRFSKDCGYRWDYYREELMLLPGDTLELFARLKYLPRRYVCERIIHYAIIAANSLIKNRNCYNP